MPVQPQEGVVVDGNEAPRAFWLTIGMARKAGVNLPEAVAEGWLTRRDLARLVDSCASCGLSRKCTGWLALPGEAPLPIYCRNKMQIEALAPHPPVPGQAPDRLKTGFC